MAEELGERQGAILNAVVAEFIASGDPVGSKHLVGRYQLSVSSATVRNDMSRLEDLGFLAQPHTSAGRIPTDLGYRFFVDHLSEPALGSKQERAVERELAPAPGGLEDLLQRASEVLSRHTKQASAVLAPAFTGAKLRHVDLVRLSPQLALVVVVTDAGRVEKRLIEFQQDISQDDLDSVQRDLNRTLIDARLIDARTIAGALATQAMPKEREIIEGVGSSIGDVVAEESRVFVGGTSNLANEPALAQSDALHGIFEELERQTTVMQLLAHGLTLGTSVQIGGELSAESLKPCSVVMSSYTVGGTPLGTVGVIGPTRMDYTQAMAMTRAVAKTIAEHLEQIAGP